MTRLISPNRIVKRPKISEYAQIDNKVLRKLGDIRANGLLIHLMSLPTDWVVRKTQLYSLFGRGLVIKGISILEDNKHWVEIGYRDGSRNVHAYHISDVAFSDAEICSFIADIREAGFPINKISAPFQHLLAGKKEENVCPFSDVEIRQQELSVSTSTVKNEQLLNKKEQRKEKQINSKQKKIVNLQQATNSSNDSYSFKQELTAACNNLYAKYAPGRWSKQAWQTLIDTFMTETIDSGRYKHIQKSAIPSYAEATVINMTRAHDHKAGRTTIYKMIPNRPVPFFDWVSEGSEEKDQNH